MNRHWQAGLLVGLIVGVCGPGRVEAGPINPNGFTANGPLILGPGTYDFDTAQSGAPALYLNTNGTLKTVALGVYSGGVAVFDFTSIGIASGANVSYLAAGAGVPIALLSTSTVAIAGTIDLSAGATSDPNAYYARPYQAPGTSNAASGGNGTGVSGSGYGQSNAAFSGGGGGGFGGSGTAGQMNYAFNSTGGIAATAPGGAGGAGYFDLSTRLQGGSGGGSGGNSSGGAGGAGGGGIEIVAAGTLLVSGTILANGQAGFSPTGFGGGGGGGSGGGIYLSAYSMSLSGTINALGGSGAQGQSFGLTTGSGGDGGGGLILAQYNSHGTYTNTGSVSAGTGRFDVQSVPEPSSLAMLGAASGLGIIVALAARRRAGSKNPA